MLDDKAIAALTAWLQGLGVPVVSMDGARKLSGGAIQENWALDIHLESGPQQSETLPVVVRADAPSGVSESWGRPQEFALLQTAFKAGVTVPEPLWLGDVSVLGRQFFIMRRVQGVAAGYRVVKEAGLASDKEALVHRIGVEMARLHHVLPPCEALNFLPLPRQTPVKDNIADWRAYLDQHHTPFPLLEWGIRWLEINEPEPLAIVLTHRDFRTGNYMIDANGLTAVLDWEFAAWSDPREDLGWFCARCWRFGQNGPGKEAGGLGSREELLAGYRSVSGIEIPVQDLHFWEVYAHVRWAMIALMQGERHVSGREPSLELALTAHIVPELELEILHMTGVINAART